MIPRALRLVPPLFRYVAEEVVRGRRAYFVTVIAGIAIVTFLATLTRGADESGVGIFLMLGLLGVAAPFCRSWIDEDVRLGYAALWLQKPVRPLDFYLGRLLALIAWSAAATLALILVTVGAAMAAGARSDLFAAAVGVFWIPTVLVILAFLGSALGARNGALFAYGVLFAGFSLPGFEDTLGSNPLFRLLEILLPPAIVALNAPIALARSGFAAALLELRPILVYALVCVALALALVLNVPRRMTRSA